MPKYEDLSFISKKILDIGDEVRIVEESGQPLNTTPIPEELAETVEPEEMMEDLLKDDLLSDIEEDFDEGLLFDETETASKTPEEEQTSEETEEELQSEESLEDISDTPSGGTDDFTLDTKLESMLDSEKEAILRTSDSYNGETPDWDELRDETSLDDLTGLDESDLDEGNEEIESLLEDAEKNNQETDGGQPEEIESMTEDLSLEGLDDIIPAEGEGTEPTPESEIMMESTEDGLSDLLETPEESSELEDTAPSDEEEILTDLSGTGEESADIDDLAEPISPESSGDSADMGGLEDLLEDSLTSPSAVEDNTSEETQESKSEELSGLDDLDLEETPEEEPENPAESIEDDTLAQLAGEFSDLSPGKEDTLDGITLDESLSDLAGEMAESKETEEPIETITEEPQPEEAQQEELEELSELDQLEELAEGEEVSEPEAPSQPMEDLENLEDLDQLEEPAPEEGEEEVPLQDLEETPEEPAAAEEPQDNLEELLSDIDLGEGEDQGLPDIEDFNLDNLDELTEEPIEEIEIEEVELKEGDEVSDLEEVKEGKKPPQPEEPVVQATGDPDAEGHIELTPEQRKQILLALSSLPKEAEIKIANTIIEKKYSDIQLKSLLDALIDKQEPKEIFRIYEDITGDSSLKSLAIEKFTGLAFEERKKTFAYVFQKNIYPVLVTVSVALLAFLMVILLLSMVILPEFRAYNHYARGKKHIE
ncbi:MAG: hypothetical protein MJB14_04775, partial [Spirochaetes bacterium]|nr:hypothetical protein [Spirochaetota bacterium]